MRYAKQVGLLQRMRAKTIPLYVTMEITNRCNLSCHHCMRDSTAGNELTFCEVKHVIDQVAEAGALHLIFTGGEPFLRKDFLHIASYARQRQFCIHVFSNGTLITEAVADKIGDLDIDIRISLHGASAEAHDKVTGVPNSFCRTVGAIQWLVERGVHVEVGTVAMKSTFEELDSIQSFCNELGVADWHTSFMVFPTDTGSSQPLQYRLSDDEFRQVIHHYPEDLREREDCDVDLLPMCGAGIFSCAISASGDVFPCGQLRIAAGNLRNRSFSDIWGSSPILQRIRSLTWDDFSQCRDCPLLFNCMRCAGLAYQEHGDMCLPALEACRLARISCERR